MPDSNPANDQRISLFLRKLWTLVNSQETDNVITWSEDGDSFIIKNQVEFCDILPRYFKHNNFMSFVRQLHLYGFSKRISDVDHTSIHGGSSSEYAHPYFLKEHPCLLLSIKQKRGEKVQPSLKTDIDTIDTISTLIKEVNTVKDKNKMLDSKFMAMKHENECLWRELAVIRQKHMKQQRILNQLIQFLVTLRQPGANNLCREVKNNVRYVLPIMHNKTSEKSNSSETFTNPKYKPSTSSGPVIHELDAADILNSNDLRRNYDAIIDEVVESEGVVASPSSTSQMFNSPSGSIIEDIFPSNEIVMNSPLDELIREVSVSPTEELLEPQSDIVTVSSLNPEVETDELINNLSIKRGKKDINPTKKKMKIIPVDKNVNQFKPKFSAKPYVIKVEPSSGDDPPVISIPEMDLTEPELTISNNDVLLNDNKNSNNDNMQLAHPEPREAVTKQIDTIQADLDNLLKGLNDKFTFDANMFLNYINDDPTNLNLPITSEEHSLNDFKNELNVTPDNQIVSCLSPNTYDLSDLMKASDDWTIPNTPTSFDSTIGNYNLDTPVLTDSLLNSDSLFPNTLVSDPPK